MPQPFQRDRFTWLAYSALALGSLADAVGIRSAYSVVLVLLIGVLLITQIAGRISSASS